MIRRQHATTGLFLAVFRLTATGFGQPGMVPHTCKLPVEKRQWLDEQTFRDGAGLG